MTALKLIVDNAPIFKNRQEVLLDKLSRYRKTVDHGLLIRFIEKDCILCDIKDVFESYGGGDTGERFVLIDIYGDAHALWEAEPDDDGDWHIWSISEEAGLDESDILCIVDGDSWRALLDWSLKDRGFDVPGEKLRPFKLICSEPLALRQLRNNIKAAKEREKRLYSQRLEKNRSVR